MLTKELRRGRLSDQQARRRCRGSTLRLPVELAWPSAATRQIEGWSPARCRGLRGRAFLRDGKRGGGIARPAVWAWNGRAEGKVAIRQGPPIRDIPAPVRLPGSPFHLLIEVPLLSLQT